MKNIKKQDYKKILFLGTFLTPTLIELMATEGGKEALYRLLKLYVEGNILLKPKECRGGVIRDNNEEYEIVIG